MRWTWWHKPRGGYGYQIPVNAKVLGRKRGRVHIEVQKRSGQTARRWVQRNSIRRRR